MDYYTDIERNTPVTFESQPADNRVELCIGNQHARGSGAIHLAVYEPSFLEKLVETAIEAHRALTTQMSQQLLDGALDGDKIAQRIVANVVAAQAALPSAHPDDTPEITGTFSHENESLE